MTRTNTTEIDTTEIAGKLRNGLAAIVDPKFPNRRGGSSVKQNHDEVHLYGREDQEADLLVDDDGTVLVRAVVRIALPPGADAAAVATELRRLGVL